MLDRAFKTYEFSKDKKFITNLGLTKNFKEMV